MKIFLWGTGAKAFKYRHTCIHRQQILTSYLMF